MSDKAFVSKELHAKHAKILEGLLRLPENRECADCRRKAPRWASVNLGIFICMQCSGIHRSLGTHISKVRSTTLDTWLPDQIALMQSMGNQKSNSHWEAELPSEFDRSAIERFIRAKYEEKRWVPKKKAQSTPKIIEKSANINNFVAVTRKDIPKKARKFSLDERILTRHMSQITHQTTRSRGGSLDMNNEIDPSAFRWEMPSTAECTSFTSDFYNLHCTQNKQQNCSGFSSGFQSWETFE